MIDDDAGLMRLVSQGDKQAFRALVERYQKAIFNYFLRTVGNTEDAEDLTQQLFINLYRSADRYRPKASFRTYLYRIATNLAISFARKRKLRVTQSLEKMMEDGYNPTSDSGTVDQEEYVKRRELQRAYLQALVRLPPDCRTAIELRIGKDLSYKEIAEVMGKSVSAVESLIFRARERLAWELKEFKEREESD